MPIRPENKALYPKDWKQIRARIQERAGDKCELCGVKNHAWGYRDKDGVFSDISNYGSLQLVENGVVVKISAEVNRINQARLVSNLGYKIIRIICTVMHLNHDPRDNRDENLKFGCQKCHNNYDKDFRAENRKKNKLLKPNAEAVK